MTKEELEKRLYEVRSANTYQVGRVIDDLISDIIPDTGHAPGTRPTRDGWFEYWNPETEEWEAVKVIGSSTKFHDFITVNDEVLIVERTNPSDWGRRILMPGEEV